MFSIGVLGFIEWSHHMNSIRLDVDLIAYLIVAIIIIAVLTGIIFIG
jgi:heme/copper-type cytochrome/quinol oxidase subunit 1